eukprot:CAMPEP_0114299774 /NCGR_PEP_ID=MMETSP0059-20121206/13162_1 /TAXON_ID=36894 /ORGANISM="Pyramimonas parkeae, Strain CCMP726" /LENGTH=84 /DNA_ID=CAMNT_0001422287 /DNA_START=130 /DNA_END=381 /DNA_ORIENTATION=+
MSNALWSETTEDPVEAQAAPAPPAARRGGSYVPPHLRNRAQAGGGEGDGGSQGRGGGYDNNGGGGGYGGGYGSRGGRGGGGGAW